MGNTVLSLLLSDFHNILIKLFSCLYFPFFFLVIFFLCFIIQFVFSLLVYVFCNFNGGHFAGKTKKIKNKMIENLQSSKTKPSAM